MNHLIDQLEEALIAEGGAFNLADVDAAIKEGKAQAWESDRGIVITEIHDAPRAKILHFWLAAGELEEVLRLADVAMEAGRNLGCTVATLTGRRGWEKKLAARGWTNRLTIMGRSL